LPCSLTRFNAGSNIAIRTAIIAMTTKSSINVNPRDLRITFYPPIVIQTVFSRSILPGYTMELLPHKIPKTKTKCNDFRIIASYFSAFFEKLQ
jgi:hypothetical protein